MSNNFPKRIRASLGFQLLLALGLNTVPTVATAAEQCAAQCTRNACRPVLQDCARYETVCPLPGPFGNADTYRACQLAKRGCYTEARDCMERCDMMPAECTEDEDQEQDESQDDTDAQEEEQDSASDQEIEDQSEELELDPENHPDDDNDNQGDQENEGRFENPIDLFDEDDTDDGGAADSGDGGSGGGAGGDSGGGGSGSGDGADGDSGGDGDSDSGGGSGGNSDGGFGGGSDADWSGGPPRIPGWPPAGGNYGGGANITICVGAGACTIGDPHLRSFDGVYFDFQGAGEYHFALSEEQDIDVQVRYEPASNSKTISLATAVAAKVGDNRVTAVAAREPFLEINGDPVTLQSGLQNALVHESGLIIDRHDRAYRINMSNGVQVTVFNFSYFMNIEIVSSEQQLRGLGGSNDSNRDNEFTTRDGVTLAVSDAELSYEQRYRQFGDSWRIKSADSLLDYADGESTSTYTDLSFPANHMSISMLDSDARRRAEEICRAAGVLPGPDLNYCIYDVGFTGDIAFVDAYIPQSTYARVTLEGPATIAVGSTIDVQWTGPANERDYIALAKPGSPANQYETYRYVSTDADQNLTTLTAPGIPGDYELRYVLAEDSQIISAKPLTLTPVTAALQAPATVAAGATIDVQWTGPANERDYIALAKPESPGNQYDSYLYVSTDADQNLATLTAPGIPGDYELRYVLAADSQIITAKPLAVTPVTAALQAPATVAAGATIDVQWTGPANERDYIALAKPESPGNQYDSYLYISTDADQNLTTLTAPGIPGDYELRYVLAADSQIITAKRLAVTPVTATLRAPATVTAGAEIMVQWTGPAYGRDHITLAVPGSPGSQYVSYKYVSTDANEDQLVLRAPTETGNYVLRYIVDNDRQIVAEVPIEVK